MKSTKDSPGRAAPPLKLQKRGTGVVAVPRTPLSKLTAEKVRETLERIRR